MFDIVKNRKIFYIISAVIIAVGIVMMFVQGFTTDTEFAGGVECTVTTGKTVDSSLQSTIIDTVNGAVGQKPTVQKSGTGTDVIIKLAKELNLDETATFKTALTEKLGIEEKAITSFEVVSPVIGRELQRSAILALVIAILLMLVYIIRCCSCDGSYP